MDCYSCDQPAINACKRCARTYCEDHGNAQYCAECLRPASALPSFNLYRGALLTMLVGTAVAVFLIVRPPGETKGAPVRVGVSTATATPAGGTPEPTIPPRTPVPSSTPATTPTAAAPTEEPFLRYTVQEGDSLFAIAEANVPPGDDIAAYARAIANLNGLDYDNPTLRIGQELLLPKPAQ